MLVTKQIEIDMGHRVPNHKSKCRNIHGHRYVIEVGVFDKIIDDKGASDEGMVIDFSDLKDIMMSEIDAVYDHSFTISDEDEFVSMFYELKRTKKQKINIVEFIPTAENLAKHWYRLISDKLLERNIAIKYVKVWETPTSTAIYTRKDDRKFVDKKQKTLAQYPSKKW